VDTGAVVRSGVRLERCVLWPGATATDSATDYVFVA